MLIMLLELVKIKLGILAFFIKAFYIKIKRNKKNNYIITVFPVNLIFFIFIFLYSWRIWYLISPEKLLYFLLDFF